MKEVFKNSAQKFKGRDRRLFGLANFRRERKLFNAYARLRDLLLKSRRVTSRNTADKHLKDMSKKESFCASQNIPKLGLEDNDCQKMISFPRVRVTSLGPNLLIQIITLKDWCLLSSILLVLEQDNLDVCSAQTISLQSKVFHTILVKVLDTSTCLDIEGLRFKLYIVSSEKSD